MVGDREELVQLLCAGVAGGRIDDEMREAVKALKDDSFSCISNGIAEGQRAITVELSKLVDAPNQGTWAHGRRQGLREALVILSGLQVKAGSDDECAACVGTGTVEDPATIGPPSFGFIPCPDCQPQPEAVLAGKVPASAQIEQWLSDLVEQEELEFAEDASAAREAGERVDLYDRIVEVPVSWVPLMLRALAQTNEPVVLTAAQSALPAKVSPVPAGLEDVGDDTQLSVYQRHVGVWVLKCFTPEIAADITERADRFIEEALELAQAAGWTSERGHALVDYVFSRPVGQVGQEVGGVMVTLAAMCNALRVSIGIEAQRELARISQPEIILKIRAKQASKPVGSALPMLWSRSAPIQSGA